MIKRAKEILNLVIEMEKKRNNGIKVMGLMPGDSESEASWSEFFSWLKLRGLHGVDIIVSDHHKGLIKAIRQEYWGLLVGRRIPHLLIPVRVRQMSFLCFFYPK